MCFYCLSCFFFFKQKTAYEMRISDWSSDVCSSDLSIASVLADTWLMDYEPETRRLRYRLVGENIRARFGIPLVGKHLDDFLGPEARVVVVPSFSACVEKPAVSMVIGRLRSEERRVGEVCVRTCRSGWSPYHKTKKQSHASRGYWR